jgi:hypothetical protein
MSEFAKELLKKYNKSPSEIAFENLQKIDSKLNPDNIFALAYMACNPALDEEEREIFKECLKIKIEEHYRKPILRDTSTSVEINFEFSNDA